jgi:glycosyltransferase involved in cell wall biosynthesis
MPHLSVILPVCNESSLIQELISRVKSNVDLITNNYEIILIDDGSVDGTWELIQKEAFQDNRIKGKRFSKNFGQHYAITAGIHNSEGDWIVVMDGDLQDRPEVIPALYRKALEGFDVVFVSRANRQENFFYLILQRIFYIGLRALSGLKLDYKQANFSIISCEVKKAYMNFPEKSRFYGSTIKWLGFKTSSIEANHGRRHSGKTAYSFRKRIKLALDIILAFSDRPLRFSIYIGFTSAILSSFGILYILYKQLVYGFKAQGWASLMLSIYLIGGLILIILGIIGIYISRIFTEVKNRPLFVISESIN